MSPSICPTNAHSMMKVQWERYRRRPMCGFSSGENIFQCVGGRGRGGGGGGGRGSRISFCWRWHVFLRFDERVFRPVPSAYLLFPLLRDRMFLTRKLGLAKESFSSPPLSCICARNCCCGYWESIRGRTISQNWDVRNLWWVPDHVNLIGVSKQKLVPSPFVLFTVHLHPLRSSRFNVSSMFLTSGSV